MDAPSKEFALAGTLEELKIKGQLVVHGGHRPILVIYDRGRVFALDNRCPHMGFPLERGSVEDGILTCHWHHARFDLESGCTFDLWADDVPICPVEVRNGDVWVKTTFTHADPAAHWHQRLANGLAHDLGLVIAKAIHGQLAAGLPQAEIVRQVALFGAQNRDGWGVGLTILTALANLLPVLPAEEAYLALFHGARRVAADCDGAAPRRERAPLGSRPDPAALKRWLRRWTKVRHREAAERTLLTAVAAGFSPAELADALFAAETERAFADTGHSLDFINKAFECLDLVGWQHAAALLPTVVGQMAAARGAEESTAWRQPVDFVALCEDSTSELAGLFAVGCGSGKWSGRAALAQELLGEDPARIVAALKEALDDLPADPETIGAALLDAFDRQRQVDLAARLVARHLTLGHSPQPLIATLAHAVLREDAGFHTYQMLEAGVRQFGAWGDTDEGRHILIAVARYLAAHSPTERASLQTADIARRLMRGGELHQEAGSS